MESIIEFLGGLMGKQFYMVFRTFARLPFLVLLALVFLACAVPDSFAATLRLEAGRDKNANFLKSCCFYSSQFAADSGANKGSTSSDPSGQGISEREAFETARALDTLEAWQTFLESFPTGFRADLARAYVKQLDARAAANSGETQQTTPAEIAISPKPDSSKKSVEFIFGANEVRSASSPTSYVKLGESISISELKDRFSPFKVTLENECDGFCILVRGDKAAIQIFLNEQNTKIIGIRTWGEGTADTNGNKAGDSLISANGANQMKCHSGESTECESAKISGLNYITGESGGCSFDVKDGAATTIPKCAKIDGFSL